MGDQSYVAVVTGANRGMGLEVCRQLAERGMRVVLTCREAAKGEQAVADLAELIRLVAVHEVDRRRAPGEVRVELVGVELHESR